MTYWYLSDTVQWGQGDPKTLLHCQQVWNWTDSTVTLAKRHLPQSICYDDIIYPGTFSQCQQIIYPNNNCISFLKTWEPAQSAKQESLSHYFLNQSNQIGYASSLIHIISDLEIQHAYLQIIPYQFFLVWAKFNALFSMPYSTHALWCVLQDLYSNMMQYAL